VSASVTPGADSALAGWARRLARHGLSVLGLVFAVTVLTFAITEIMPGDPAVAILGESAMPEQIVSLRTELGMDRPLWQRYASWLGNALSGDLGHSYRSNESIAQMLADRLPVSIQLVLMAQVLALGFSVPAAVFAAYRPGGRFDRAMDIFTTGLISMPAFMVGLLLIYVLAVHAGLFPAAGYKYLSDGLWLNMSTMLLPALTLAQSEIPVYMRLLRAEMISTLQQEYILVARAKGLAPQRILWRHALKPSSFSLITVVGVNMGRLVGGAVIIETLFALPGMGQMLVTAVYQHDHFVIQGIVLVVAVGFVFINVAVDSAYALLDPRVRHATRS